MPNQFVPLKGLIAATFTPMNAQGELDLEIVPEYVEHLLLHGIAGLYVAGSTGEGPSLASDERRAVAEAFVSAADQRLPVIVQVGCESLVEAARLAEHAQRIGATAVSAVSPVYFKPPDMGTLVKSMAQIAAAAPQLPFFYYHIPAVTGVTWDMLAFLELAEQSIPTLRGAKFTSANMSEYQACVAYAPDRLEMLWGMDDMLLAGLAAGGRAAVGSTYNFAAPLYQRLIEALAAGNLTAARRHQATAQAMVRTFMPYGPRGAQKAIMAMIGLDCGPPRLPVPSLPATEFAALQAELSALGFFEWIGLPDRCLTNKATSMR